MQTGVHTIVSWLVVIEPCEGALAVDPQELGIEVPAYVAEWHEAVKRHGAPRAVVLVTTVRDHRVPPCLYDAFHGSLPQDEASLASAAIAALEQARDGLRS